jgi:hypothetical protein
MLLGAFIFVSSFYRKILKHITVNSAGISFRGRWHGWILEFATPGKHWLSHPFFEISSLCRPTQ